VWPHGHLKVAFTGTQFGMTLYQRSILGPVLLGLEKFQFHHGGAAGADTEAHGIAYDAGCRDLHVWLPIGKTWAPMPFTTIHHTGLGALRRNHFTIYGADLLIATPRQAREIRRSGTWATVRAARKAGIETKVLVPQPADEEGTT
jgi:hypothetical protein